jgi:hypothetical protein
VEAQQLSLTIESKQIKVDLRARRITIKADFAVEMETDFLPNPRR